MSKDILDPSYKYEPSVESKTNSNYLKEKWDKLYPGWNKKPVPNSGEAKKITVRVLHLNTNQHRK